MLKLPKFPEFKSLEISDKKQIQRFVGKFPPYSDFNFTSLYCWDIDNSAAICKLNGNLVVKFNDYITGESFLTFIGKRRVTATALALLEHSQEKKEMSHLQLIPHHVAVKLSSKRLKISEDRDQHDYILSVSDQLNLAGSKNHSKKRRINKLINSDLDIESMHLHDFNNPDVLKSVAILFDKWASAKSSDIKETENESKAIHRLIKTRELDTEIFIIKVDNRVVAFQIGELLPGDFYIGHFEKADPEIQGLFQYLRYVVAQNLTARGVRHYNIEQDLGIQSMRQSKTELRPVGFLKKYTVSLKED